MKRFYNPQLMNREVQLLGEIITNETLMELDNKLQNIETQKSEILQEKERLIKLRELQQELISEIGEYLILKHGFTSLDEFYSWHENVSNMTESKNPVLSVETVLLNTLDSVLESKSLSKSEASSLLGYKSNYLDTLIHESAKNVFDLIKTEKAIKDVTTRIRSMVVNKPSNTPDNPDDITTKIDDWLESRRVTKYEMSQLTGYTKTYIHQQYSKLKSTDTLVVNQAVKALGYILQFIEQCDNPLNALKRHFTDDSRFIILVRIDSTKPFMYYAKEQVHINAEDFLDLSYTDIQYDAKLIDRDTAIRFYTNFKDEHPETPLTILPVQESQIGNYLK